MTIHDKIQEQMEAHGLDGVDNRDIDQSMNFSDDLQSFIMNHIEKWAVIGADPGSSLMCVSAGLISEGLRVLAMAGTPREQIEEMVLIAVATTVGDDTSELINKLKEAQNDKTG